MKYIGKIPLSSPSTCSRSPPYSLSPPLSLTLSLPPHTPNIILYKKCNVCKYWIVD